MWQIESVEILGPGYLRGLNLPLPPGLTCIIGPRGSGKTSLAEALRFALTGLPADSKTRLSLLKDNLGQATVVIRTVSGDADSYTVSRSFPDTAAVSTRDGRSLSNVELDRGTFLPFDAFSSREIEDIADESLGSKRRQLLDSLRAEELREIDLAIGTKRRSLDSNSDLLRSLNQAVADLREQIEELSGARERLAALPLPEKGEEADRLAASTRQQSLNRSELEQLRKVWSDIANLKGRLGEDQSATDSIGVPFELDSINAEALRAVSDLMMAGRQEASSHISKAVDRLARLQVAINESGKALKETQEEQLVAHQRLIESHAVLGQAAQVRNKAEQDVARLAKLEADLNHAQKKTEETLVARRVLKAEYLTQRDRVSALREETAARLGEDCGRNVRLRVERYADSHVYQQLLLRGLSGTGIRGQDEIVQALMTLRPEQLSQTLLENDVEELEHSLRLGPERTKRVFDALRGSINPLELDVLATDDKICIELNVGTDEDPLYKDAAELSRGQKCTALLPLLLARRNSPLLIDQPEDNLDNHFIYETVVEAIRRMKSKRQMVFITHNANIPVLAEAELVVVMNSDGREGHIQKMGTLDDCRVEIVDLLEGGQEAFAKRSERYGR